MVISTRFFKLVCKKKSVSKLIYININQINKKYLLFCMKLKHILEFVKIVDCVRNNCV